MDFVKKHYEKILLGVVLLGLVIALASLPYWIARDTAILKETRIKNTTSSPSPIPPLDVTGFSNAIQRLQLPCKLNFETTNKLFNPVEWQKAMNGSLIKIETGKEVGPQAVQITQIIPLYFVLTLDSVETNEVGIRYVVGVENQAAAARWKRTKRQYYASVGEKNDVFTVTTVKGLLDNPAQLVLRLTDTGETVAVSKDKPFRRVSGYKADLKYGPEEKSWQDQRIDDDLKFAGDDYIIVAIDENEVVLSAKSNQKKTTLTYHP